MQETTKARRSGRTVAARSVIHGWRLAIVALAGAVLLAGGARAASASPVLTFDGTAGPKVLEQSVDHVTGWELGAVTVRFRAVYAPPAAAGAAAPSTKPGAVLVDLRGANDLLLVSLAGIKNRVEFTSDKSEPISIDLPPPAGGRPLLGLTLRRDDRGGGGWTVSAEGVKQPVGRLPRGFFEPKPDDAFLLRLGGPAFVGDIEFFGIDAPDGEAVVRISDAGEPVKRFMPRLGVYLQADTEINVPRPDPRGGGVEHGLYGYGAFSALVRRNGRLGVVFDWGGYLDLAPDPRSPRRFLPVYPALAWVGALEFADGTDEVFTAGDVSDYRPAAVPVFENGKRYIHVEQLGGLDNQNPSGQRFDEVWVATAKPSGFGQSVRACFDIVRSNLIDARSGLIDFQSTGCTSTIFQLPPPESANYRASEDNTVVPYGWRYDRRHRSQGSYFSSLATSSGEVERSFNGSDGSGFNALLSLSTNTSVSDRQNKMLTEERMVSVHQNIATSHAIVLDPIYVRLNNCFIRRVLRMDPTATPPEYYDPETDPKLRQPGASEDSDYCPEAPDGPRAVPLTASRFLDLYGTHYAYAIVYGAWGRQTTTYTVEGVEELVERGTDVSQSVGVEATVKGTKVGANQEFEAGRKAMTRLAGEGKLEMSEYACIGGGASCTESIDASSNLVPAYLHLRTLDGLLAPPYFTDPKVTVDLRAKVRAEIERRLAGAPAAPDVAPYRLVQLTIDRVSCAGTDLFNGTVCPANTAESPLRDVDLFVYGRLADGRKVLLAPPQTFRMTDLMSPAVPKMFPVLRRSPAGPIDRLALSIAPHGWAASAAGGATTTHGCCDETWFLEGTFVLSPGEGPDTIESATLSTRWGSLSSGTTREIVFPYASIGTTNAFNGRILELKGRDGVDGGIEVAGSLDVVDVAASLGFPDQPRWFTAAFEALRPEAEDLFTSASRAHPLMVCPPGSWKVAVGCEYASPPPGCPAGLERYGRVCAVGSAPREIVFGNDGLYVASADVRYTVDGTPHNESSPALLIRQSHTFSVPADAQQVWVTGQYHGLFGKQALFSVAIDPADGPTCFAATGDAVRRGWRQEFGDFVTSNWWRDQGCSWRDRP